MKRRQRKASWSSKRPKLRRCMCFFWMVLDGFFLVWLFCPMFCPFTKIQRVLKQDMQEFPGSEQRISKDDEKVFDLEVLLVIMRYGSKIGYVICRLFMVF